jgi:serine/threonine protein kinase
MNKQDYRNETYFDIMEYYTKISHDNVDNDNYSVYTVNTKESTESPIKYASSIESDNIEDNFIKDLKTIAVDSDKFFKQDTDNYKLLQKKGYEIISIIGQGSSSTVYKVIKNNMEYAMKISNDNDKSQKEYNLLQALNHECVIRVYDFFTIKDNSFMVMELYGQDLYEYLSYNSLNKSEKSEIIRQICKAIKYCHDNSVYHRDLKPENILIKTIQEKVHIKITDFYLSTQNKISSEIIGSERYMSPECTRFSYTFKEFSSEMNDIWSFGIIILNILSKKHPWTRACLSDELYCKIFSEDDYFKTNLHVSNGMNELLYSIFSKETNRCDISFISEKLQSQTKNSNKKYKKTFYKMVTLSKSLV